MPIKVIFLTLLLCLGTVPAFSQNETDPIKLNEHLTVLVQQGDLKGAIPIADKIIEIQRRDAAKPRNLVTALENAASIRLTRYKRAVNDPKPDDLSAKDLAEQPRTDAKRVEDLLHEAIALAKISGSAPEQIVGMESDLAWLLYHFFPAPPNTAAGFDRKDRAAFDAQLKAIRDKRLSEAKQLYEDAVSRSEKDLPADSDSRLASIFNLAEYQTAVGDLESAAAGYKTCIEVVTKKYGTKSENLLPPLRAYLKLAAAADDADEVFETMSRIVRASGKSTQAPNQLLNVTPRAAEAFSTWVSEEQIARSKATAEMAELQARGNTAQGGSLTQVQAGSTFGKVYYDSADAVRIYGIPVRVLVAEDGKVTEAEALTTDRGHAAEAEKIVKAWRFRPYTFNGKPAKLKGYVECLFMSNLFKK
ncbi:MAG: energy transducer TonB [Acidobacteriota bacterium]